MFKCDTFGKFFFFKNSYCQDFLCSGIQRNWMENGSGVKKWENISAECVDRCVQRNLSATFLQALEIYSWFTEPFFDTLNWKYFCSLFQILFQFSGKLPKSRPPQNINTIPVFSNSLENLRFIKLFFYVHHFKNFHRTFFPFFYGHPFSF